MTGQRVVVVDTETTGLNPDDERIVEVALVTVDLHTGEVVDVFSTVIDPLAPLRCTDIHGITAADVDGAPTFRQVWPGIEARLRGAVVAGHNVAFDWGFLTAEAARNNVDLPGDVRLVDTKTAASRTLDIPSHRLIHCCAHLGIDLTGAHSAADDALATAELLLRLADLDSELGDLLLSHAATLEPVAVPLVPVRGRQHLPPPDREAV
jgi:DNA polymerase III epsilon subunit-like protein